MTETIKLKASRRDVLGKANRKLGPEGLLPAVLYGSGVEATAIAVDRHDFGMIVQQHADGLGSTVIKLAVEGLEAPVNAMVKSLQTSPTKGALLHVDFLAVDMDQTIQTSVPLHFDGVSPGIKAGGVLNTVAHTVHVEALPNELPESIVADISGLEVGSNLHVSDLSVAPGITILDDPDTILCSVTAPTLAPTEEEVTEAVEPEVIGAEESE